MVKTFMTGSMSVFLCAWSFEMTEKPTTSFEIVFVESFRNTLAKLGLSNFKFSDVVKTTLTFAERFQPEYDFSFTQAVAEYDGADNTALNVFTTKM